MYDLIDRPVGELPRFERGLLDRMRRWAHAFSVAGDAAADRGDEALGAVMRALDRGSGDDLVIRRPCFATVEESEAVILGLWRLARDGRARAANAAAGTLVDVDHAGPLLDGMAAVLAGG